MAAVGGYLVHRPPLSAIRVKVDLRIVCAEQFGRPAAQHQALTALP